jgi:hypothetical protein
LADNIYNTLYYGEAKMAMSNEAQEQMFGCTIDVMSREYEDSYSKNMYIMSILSDAQEVMKGSPETARQFINKAKYFISKLDQ